jgi:glutathione S-transferase
MAALRLITIPISHYCEKARWALDRAGAPYVERKYLPLAHLLPVWLAGGGHMVPLLLDGKTPIRDSTAILKHVDRGLPIERRLFPGDPVARQEVERLEDLFDEKLGPATRRWAYFHLLPDRQKSVRTLRRTVGRVAGAALTLLFPLMRRLISARYRIDPQSAARSQQRIQDVFEQVNDLLKDGRPYLAGGRFSAADLAFASLSMPIIFPDGHAVPMPRIDELPSEMARVVESFRQTPAGDFARRMYREHRRAE